MAYEERNGRSTAAPTRRRRTEEPQTNPRRRRRKKRKVIRFDLIFLAAIALVTLVVLFSPRQQIQDPNLAATNDGRNTAQTTQPTTEPTTLPPITVPPTTQFVPKPVTFTAADSDLLYVRSICDAKADVEKALLETLDWDLTDPNFTVLIIHSHISESYTLREDQQPEETSSFTSDPYRTDDERYNLVAIGKRVAEILRSKGIQVIHDTTSFEYPNSDYAYRNAREHLETLLAENPSIGLILDLHRDAVENSDGTQWAPTVTVNDEKCARISMLIGYTGSYDSKWDQNLSFALKLGARLNQNVEKTFRQLLVVKSRTAYNQDLGPVSMLIEVGTAGNSFEEALNAAELLAQGLLDLGGGANLE